VEGLLATSSSGTVTSCLGILETTFQLLVDYFQDNRSAHRGEPTLGRELEMEHQLEHRQYDQSQSHTRQKLGLMGLPTEVRHAIYEYLFCHKGSPVWLGTKHMGFESFEPTFHTQLFRVCKDISLDAISFAYSANAFVLRDSFPAFCGLGKAALGAITSLTVVHSSWTVRAMEDALWNVIKTDCVGLKSLELDLHSDVLLEVIKYLGDFFGSLQQDQFLTLDLYVWERYFAFVDNSDHEYTHSLHLLNGIQETSSSTPRFINPQERVTRLPPSARDIVLSADVYSGAIQALDNFLESNKQIPLTKERQCLPKVGRRACGRSARYCYVWADAERKMEGSGNLLEGEIIVE